MRFKSSILTKATGAITMATFLLIGGITTANARPENELVTNISVNGDAVDIMSGTSSTLAGTIIISNIEFDSSSNALLFEGTIAGTVTRDSISTQILNQVFTTSGTLINNGAKKCELLTLDLGRINLDLLGLQLDLSEINLDLSAIKGKGKLLGNLLCGLTNLLNPPDIDMINRQLTRINSILGTVLENISVQAPLENGGNFTGFLTIQGLSVDGSGNLVFNGVLNGVAVADSTTTSVINQAISTSGTLNGSNTSGKGKKCEILALDLAPVNLDVLGLHLDLSEVTLDLNAVTGSGKLLGNLLCKLTKTLDSNGNGHGSPDKAAKKLLQATQKINQLLM